LAPGSQGVAETGAITTVLGLARVAHRESSRFRSQMKVLKRLRPARDRRDRSSDRRETEPTCSVPTSGEQNQNLTLFTVRQPQVLVDCHSCLVGQLEPDRPTALPLPNRRAIHRVPARRHVVDTDSDDVTATKLAVDRQVGTMRGRACVPPSAAWSGLTKRD